MQSTNAKDPLPTRLVTVQPAKRAKEPGIDVIVVHGVRTLGLGRLPCNWAHVLQAKLPANSGILSYDNNFSIEDGFQWKPFDQQSVELLDAIIQESQSITETRERDIVFIAYGLAGAVLKEALNKLSRQSEYETYIQSISGIIFIATPHIQIEIPEAGRDLSGIVRYIPSRFSKSQIPTNDIQSYAKCSRRFKDLDLQCPILSCYEQIDIKVLVKFNFSRDVQRVTHSLARILASKEKLVGIDCPISKLFDSAKCAIHDSIADFLMDISRRAAKATAPGLTDELDSWVDVSHQLDITPLHDSPNAFEEQRSVLKELVRSDRNEELLTSGSQSAGLNTPRDISPASNPSYVVILEPHEADVPDSVTHVYNRLYKSPNDHFQGRKDILSDMEETLLPTAAATAPMAPRLPNTYVLCGAPGMGKSQTALQFFHTRRHHFNVALWVQANNHASLSTDFNRIAIKLHLHNIDHPDQQPDYNPDILLNWLRKPLRQPWKSDSHRMKWLIVFDNVDDEQVLQRFWPHHSPGAVIITTRDPLIMQSKDSNRDRVMLPSLSDKEASALLLARAGNLCDSEPESILLQVVRELNCWPLAIVQMARNMIRLGQTPSRFLSHYQNESRKLKYYGALGTAMDDYSFTLLDFWSIGTPQSIEAKKASCLLSVISFLLPESIPEEILEDASGQAGLSDYPSGLEYDEAVTELIKNSTIARATSTREVTIHSLIQEVVKGQLLKDPIQFAAVFGATIRLVMARWELQSEPTTRYREVAKTSRWVRCDQLLPHMGQLRSAFEPLPRNLKQKCVTEDYLTMLHEISWHHYLLRNVDEALDYVSAALEAHEICPNDYPRLLACQYGTWCAVAMSLNQPVIAREKGLESFRLTQECFQKTGIVDSQYVASYTELGRIMIMNDELDEAEKLIKESEKLRRQLPGFSRLHLYSPILFFSYIEVIRGHYESAELHLLQALRDREIKYGKDDIESKRAGWLLQYLGVVVTKAGRPEDGYAYFQRAYAIFLAIGGLNDLDTARTGYLVARYLFTDGDQPGALENINKAISVFSRLRQCEAEHSRSLFLKFRILTKLDGAGELAVDAEEVFQQSIQVRKQLVPYEAQVPEKLTENDFDRLLAVWLR